MRDIWLVGIGTGSPGHVTTEGMAALRDAAAILLPEKGTGKDDLAGLRRTILEAAGASAPVIPFTYPERDPSLPYQARVEAWHDEIARRWTKAISQAPAGPIALLVWGDPSLYDSTMRIAQRLDPAPRLRVIPGITAVQALTAAHAIPINTVNGEIRITTGRRLRDLGWPDGAETVVVMLDGECSFQTLDIPDLSIWWGAFLGMKEQVLVQGKLPDVTDEILSTRAKARAEHGWLMDTYLLRRDPKGEIS